MIPGFPQVLKMNRGGLKTAVCALVFAAQMIVVPAAAPAARLEWNAASLQLAQPGGDYARIIRLSNGQQLLAYSWRGQLWVRARTDAGTNWQEPVLVAAQEGSMLANAELIQLADNSVIALFNDRPRAALPRRNQPPPSGPLTQPFRIMAARSADLGKTWSAPTALYAGGCEFGNGCWEPAAIQLPGGEMQVYFANEAPYRNSDEQEITLLRSRDGARTWSAPEKISFRPKHRDGMPKPLLLRNGSDIVVAIEDNGLAGERFKPVIVATTLADNWKSGTVGASSPQRWGACTPALEPSVYGGAPYLAQLPSGEVLLSYQESEKGDLDSSVLVVRIGTAEAKDFGAPSRPLPGKTQLWNSLFVKDAHTVIAVSTATIEGQRGIWLIEGNVVR